MAFGFGGGGFNLGGVAGGLSLLGSAFLEFQAGREQAAAEKEEAQKLQRQRQAANLVAKREDQRLQQERRRDVGTLRARLAGQGLSLSGGSAERLIDLTRSRFDQQEDDEEQFRALEQQGFTSAIGAARRARGIAGISQYLSPAVSLLGAFGGR